MKPFQLYTNAQSDAGWNQKCMLHDAAKSRGYMSITIRLIMLSLFVGTSFRLGKEKFRDANTESSYFLLSFRATLVHYREVTSVIIYIYISFSLFLSVGASRPRPFSRRSFASSS